MIFDDIFSFASGDYSSNALAVASLIRSIGEDINADYAHSGTWAYISDLQNAYQKLGIVSQYGNDNSNSPVTRSDLFNMIIDNNYPVIARADNSLTGGDGHCFILDGWLRLEYSIMGSIAGEATPSIKSSTTENLQYNFDLVHINLGWNGNGDGYYLPDAFDLTSDKYKEYIEDNDNTTYYSYVYDLNVGYLIYDI